MMNISAMMRTALLVSCFIVILLSGYRLNHTGKPFNVAVFTLHKLVSLAALFLFTTFFIQMRKATGLSLVEHIFGWTTIFLFILTIVAGGLLSIEKQMPEFILWTHHILPHLTIISAAISFYLFLKK